MGRLVRVVRPLHPKEGLCRALSVRQRPFATKLQLAVALLDPLPTLADLLVVVVCDGAYARQKFVKPVCASGKARLLTLAPRLRVL